MNAQNPWTVRTSEEAFAWIEEQRRAEKEAEEEAEEEELRADLYEFDEPAGRKGRLEKELEGNEALWEGDCEEHPQGSECHGEVWDGRGERHSSAGDYLVATAVTEIHLSLTNNGAQQVLKALDVEMWAEHRDIRSEAADLLNPRLGANQEMWISRVSDAKSGESDFTLGIHLPGLCGDRGLDLLAVHKDTGAFVIGARPTPRSGPGSDLVVTGLLEFGWSSPLPRELVTELLTMRSRDALRSDVDKRLRRWEVFLEVSRKYAELSKFSVCYEGRRHLDGDRFQLSLVGTISPEDKEKLRTHRDRLEILIGHDQEGEEEGYAGPVLLAMLESYNRDHEVVIVELEKSAAESVREGGAEVPVRGRLRNSAAGELHQIWTQETAIRRLREGEALLPSLDGILYGGEDDLALPPFPQITAMAIGDCLDPEKTNLLQREAVSRALQSPDCFLLQGPPGTGKTTFIAELCYQLVKRGNRVLVSSQANLAVDNALARLHRHPRILAIRLGPSEKIEEDGQEFVGERAVRRWLDSVAEQGAATLRRLDDLNRSEELLGRHRDMLIRWVEAGCPDAEGALPEDTDEQGLLALDREIRAGEEIASDGAELLQQKNAAAWELKSAERARDEAKRSVEETRTALGAVASLVASSAGLDRIPTELCAPERIRGLFNRLTDVRAIVSGVGSGHPGKSDGTADAGRWLAMEKLGEGESAQAAIEDFKSWLGRMDSLASIPVIGYFIRRSKRRRIQELTDALLILGQAVGNADGRRLPWFATELAAWEAALRRRLASAEEDLDKAEEALIRHTASLRECEKETECERETIRRVLPSDDLPADAGATGFRELLELMKRRICHLLGRYARGPVAELRDLGAFPSGLLEPRPNAEALRNHLEEVPDPKELEREKRRAALLGEWVSRIQCGDAKVGEQLESLFFEHANVVGCTCAFAGRRYGFRDRFPEFDVVIVDEVSKATPTELLVPCLLGRRVVLVGDHKQLPPFIGSEHSLSSAADELGMDDRELKATLNSSLFRERFEHFEEARDPRALMLVKQYRMRSQIMAGINQFYDGRLEMGHDGLDAEREHGLLGLDWLNADNHVVWVDTPASETWAHRQLNKSRDNPAEARLAVQFIEELATAMPGGKTGDDLTVGVISPYAPQVRLILRQLDAIRLPVGFRKKLRVSTVDRFQGMERDIILLSLVVNGRSTKPSPFLATHERINVAMSRARRLLLILGSSHTYVRMAGPGSPYGSFLDLAQRTDGYVRAFDVVED